MKQIFLLLTICWIIANHANAAKPVETTYYGVTFTLDLVNRTATVKKASPDITDVRLDDGVVYENKIYEVKSIGDSAFYECSELENIIMSPYLESIKKCAFAKCKKLKEIKIPSTVTEIGDGAFWLCENIKSIDFSPKKATRFGISVFRGCTSLESVKFNRGVNIPNFMFYGCTSLKEVSIPERDSQTGARCEKIGEYAFCGCESLKTVTLPTTVNRIENSAFKNCKKLTTFVIPQSTYIIGENAFDNCSSLQNIEFGESLGEIKKYAFNGCTSLRKVEFNKPIKFIREGAFQGNTNLYEIYLGDSIKTIEWHAFYNCENLTRINIESISSWLSIDFTRKTTEYPGYEYLSKCNPCSTSDVKLYLDNKLVEELVSPDDIVEIKPYAFENYSHLKHIVINKNCKNIGKYAFLNCINLEDITINSQNTYLDRGCFKACEKLSDVYVYAIKAPLGKDTPFEDSYPEYMTLHIPEDYQWNMNMVQREFWGKFGIVKNDLFFEKDIQLSLTEHELELFPFQQHKLTVNIEPQTTYEIPVTWECQSSGSKQVLYVNQEGNVSVKERGYATVSVFFDGNSEIVDTCGIRVYSKPTDIQIWGLNGRFKIGEKRFLTATIYPEDAKQEVIWTSSDESIVEINEDGEVTVISDGRFEIIATAKNYPSVYHCYTGRVYREVEAVVIDPEEITCLYGEKYQLNATVLPENGTDKSLSWSSDFRDEGKVDQNGLVSISKYTGVGWGDIPFHITARSEYNSEIKATCKVILISKRAESLTIDSSNWLGKEGETFKIQAIITPQEAKYQFIKWTSSDESVATVDRNGLVSVLKEGNCIITAQTTDGSNLSAECVVTCTAGIDDVLMDINEIFDVYGIEGVLIQKDCNRDYLKKLSSGLYILQQGNKSEKVIIR